MNNNFKLLILLISFLLLFSVVSATSVIKIGQYPPLGVTGSECVEYTGTNITHFFPFYYELNDSSTGSAQFKFGNQFFYYKVNTMNINVPSLSNGVTFNGRQIQINSSG